jgi:uncharacterized protein (DUF1330 family)
MSERLQHAAFGWPHVASGVDGRRSGGATLRNWGGWPFALDALRLPADSRTMIIEFPSRDEFRAWYDSPAYRAVLPLRLESVPGIMVVVDGFVPPAE